MGDARIGRFLLLVAPVLFGLLAMHAFVAPTGGEHDVVGGTPALVAGVERTTTAHDTAGPMAHPAPVRLAVTGGSAPATSAPPVETGSDHGPPGHHGVDHLVHLCLAVLAAVGLAVAVVWVLLGAVAPAVAAPAVRRVRTAPAGRPPPVPRRLARLCVMRN